ncbi:osmotically inducible protein C [Acuticoccus sediminis]|uniref:Osmotically inducible protein C n=2 Tax=Acuticoccus sediminis TaxID=2184697 RepID=A0A8B2NEY1_9HYPH|nr:osmotically inducible protein C [Acuticoccus sediminis]
MDHAKVEIANNGVNVAALLNARKALEEAPAAAHFTWRAECSWLDGVHSRSVIKDFHGLGEEQTRKTAFAVEADHPEVFAASDSAPTPVEIVLSALGSCLMAGVASVAQNRGVQLHSAKAIVEGDMDLYGILGIDADVRNGFSAVRVRFEIDADGTPDEIAGIVAQAQRRSAVFDLITNPTNVVVTVA